MSTNLLGDDWVPPACTLPTVEQPIRRAEFDDLFARDVLALHRESSQRIVLDLRPDPEVAAQAAGLAAKETGCCSFFAFDLAIADGSITLAVETSDIHRDVLDAFAARAETQLGVES